MISKRLEDAINAQINAELWSAYLYLSMGMNFEAKGMPGTANWFRIQFKEEQDHATIFMNYLNSRGGRVVLKPIEGVETEWATALDAFKDTLKHEKVVTGLINDLYFLAEEERDPATRSMLQWFVDEQVEEEETAQQFIDKFVMIGDNGYGLYEMDKELATRTYSAPAPLTKGE
ncbi:MAG: ferritin [Muribaculaceae bacterium]|jgi:ferritin|nr:ferritin [Muribaculaceae bacterium]MBO7165307.1 ferritin [Muribaculaceae bacterium]MBQ1185432.1 ferritin [Muribaculaceae bacterium]MBQ2370800.1 ferritin [Muribaculaceae bacterium]MBQ2398527.1 ferritin [Muribaculaceae bacterium]